MPHRLSGTRRRLALATAALLLAVPVARAGTPPSARAEVEAAFADVDARAQKARAAGDLPRWSDPDGARVLGRIWNVPAILGAPPYAAADVPVLLEITALENTVLKTYALFAPEPGTLADPAANGTRYQDEIVRSGAFLLHAQAAEVEALAAFWASLPPADRTPIRRRGLQQLRTGMVEFLTGMLMMLRSPSLRPDNRTILITGLAGTTEAIGHALPRPDRAAVGAQVAAAVASLSPEDRGQLGSVTQALEVTDCTGLCAVE